MMVISNGYKRGHPNYRAGSWHIGETLYIPDSQVITLQIDGHELQAILQALAASGITIVHTDGPLTPIL